MPGNSGNKSNKPKLHGSTNSLRDTFNQALNEATTAEQARSKANSGEGHSTKSSNTNFAELKEWYAKLDQDTRSAIDKAADKPTSRFTNEERDSFYLKVDPYHYNQYLQFRYPGKTEYIQSRMHSYYGFRRHLEENGVAPKKPSETNPETQYAEQVAKEQVNRGEAPKDKSIFDIVQDEAKAENSKSASQPTANPEKVTPEKQAAKQMVENAEAPAEQTKSEKPSEGATADAWFADMLSPDKLAAVDAAAKKQKAIEKQEAQDVQAAFERQAAQDMINNSINNSRSKNETGDAYIPWYNQSWRDIVNNTRDKNTPSPVPPNRLTGDAYPIVRRSSAPYRDFNWRENTDNLPFYNKNAVNRHIPDATHAPEFYLNPVEPLAAPHEYGPIVIRKAREKAYDQKLDRKIAVENAIKDGLWGLGILGTTAGTFYGLDKLGKYIRQDDSDEQPQTQVPYRMEPEPVNEAVVQPEPTLEQQFVLQSTSPFDYAKAANLFDLYDRYGSSDSIDNSIPEEQSADENTLQPDSDTYKNAQEMGQRIASRTGYAPELKEDNFELPQNPPKVGSNIKTAGLKSPNGGEVPQELSKLSGVKPKVIKDTSKGPIVLNDPNRRKTKDVQNNSITPERAAASQMVNQYAGIPAEVVRAKNQPFLTTDAIWNRLRQKGLVSPEEGIRSGLFTPDEVRYITENDLWRYR